MATRVHSRPPPPPSRSDDFAVRDDLAGRPVTDAELDVVEAFLGHAIRFILSGDSEVEQDSFDLLTIPRRRDAWR
jgi:hypothetical protein